MISFTCTTEPPLRFDFEPARTVRDLAIKPLKIHFDYYSTFVTQIIVIQRHYLVQNAAVKTHRSPMIDPPQ